MAEHKKILLIDCQASGVAGDMILATLIDLGANVDKVINAIKSLESPAYGYGKIEIVINQVMRGEFKATQIDVTSKGAQKKHGKELIDIVEKAVSNIELSPKAKQLSLIH